MYLGLILKRLLRGRGRKNFFKKFFWVEKTLELGFYRKRLLFFYG